MRLGNFCLLYAVLLLDTNHQHFCCTAVDAKERESPALRILSPFYYEPLEPDEFEVKIDLSSLLAPCSVVLRINGVERAGHVHENATQNSVWTWRPEESLLRELDGFNGLQVMALQAVCKKKPADAALMIPQSSRAHRLILRSYDSTSCCTLVPVQNKERKMERCLAKETSRPRS